MTGLAAARWLALGSQLFALALIANWFTWLSPPESVPRALLLLLLGLPLLLPLRGVLNAHPKSHIGLSFAGIWLFLAGIDMVANVPAWRLYAALLTVSAVGIIVGSYFYMRLAPRPTPPTDAPAD
ncbi:MAG: DUF2069 domain-containing protein [Pseudomonadota bacterium]